MTMRLEILLPFLRLFDPRQTCMVMLSVHVELAPQLFSSCVSLFLSLSLCLWVTALRL